MFGTCFKDLNLFSAGINWIKECDQEKLLSEFSFIENDLYEVIKTRSHRAERELNKKIEMEEKLQHRRRPRKWEYLKKKAEPEFEDICYDSGWRLAELIQNDSKRGSKKTESQSTPVEREYDRGTGERNNNHEGSIYKENYGQDTPGWNSFAPRRADTLSYQGRRGNFHRGRGMGAVRGFRRGRSDRY